MNTPVIPAGFGLDTPLRRAHFMAQLAIGALILFVLRVHGWVQQ